MNNLATIIKLLQIEHIIIIDLSYQDLNGMLIPREVLLNDTTYDKIKMNIPLLKQFFSSSTMTSLQSDADTNQKWPLLNLIRQILRTYDYKLLPNRLCDGRSSDGKKKYKRIFIIEKMKLSAATQNEIKYT
jgi:hypothetical protein